MYVACQCLYEVTCWSSGWVSGCGWLSADSHGSGVENRVLVFITFPSFPFNRMGGALCFHLISCGPDTPTFSLNVEYSVLNS